MGDTRHRFQDLHMHTHFAYCADDDMYPEASISEMSRGDAGTIAFTEHAGQLYVRREDYWPPNFIERPAILRDPATRRIDAYKRYVGKLRSDSVLMGLEVDLDCNGELTVLPEDRDGFDLLIAATHWIHSRFANDVRKGFMWQVEHFVRHGMTILAHPFRVFRSLKMEPPADLFRPVVDLLKAGGIAAEVNFHHNEPVTTFFELCVQEGVRISLGSDSHAVSTVGKLDRHRAFLTAICGADLDTVLLKLERQDGVWRAAGSPASPAHLHSVTSR